MCGQADQQDSERNEGDPDPSRWRDRLVENQAGSEDHPDELGGSKHMREIERDRVQQDRVENPATAEKCEARGRFLAEYAKEHPLGLRRRSAKLQH